MAPFDRAYAIYNFLLVGHCNYSCISTIFELLDVKYIVTLKSGLEITQGH